VAERTVTVTSWADATKFVEAMRRAVDAIGPLTRAFARLELLQSTSHHRREQAARSAMHAAYDRRRRARRRRR
jgi:hypothetical protein